MEMANRQANDGLQLLQRGPAAEILRLLQRNGPSSARDLQSALGVRSRNAVREQLMWLEAAGLLRAETRRSGQGRPAQMYTLSDRAQALFPKGYDVLLKLLLDEIGARHGRDGLQELLDGVSVRLAEQYGGKDSGQELEQRLQVLAEAFDARGTSIAIVEYDDAVAVHEYSCPYFNVAQTDSHVCAVEKQMLEQVLGRDVQLTRRMVDGHSACEFLVGERRDRKL
jgi:predicted ArsR family transcriptional regulator